MPIFVHFLNCGVLFDSAFSLWVSLSKRTDRNPANICFPRCLQHNNFSSSKKSSRRLAIVSRTCLKDVLKTYWKTKKCYSEDVIKTSFRRLRYVFIKTSVCWKLSHGDKKIKNDEMFFHFLYLRLRLDVSHV